MDLVFLPLAAVSQMVFGTLMFLSSVFLILLVLVQRGRGGGLAGAFGGMGGQSAFGTKAGDLFTRITMAVATFWILLCILAIAVLNRDDSVFNSGPATSAFESFGEDEGLAPVDEIGTGIEGLFPAEGSDGSPGDAAIPNAAIPNAAIPNAATPSEGGTESATENAATNESAAEPTDGPNSN